MATICPVCKVGTLKKGEKQVYCSKKDYDSKTEKNKGCDFHIFYDQKKVFGEVLEASDIVDIVNGKPLTSKRGRTIELDLTSKYFTKTTKPEDEDL
ncbi:MAG: hypothetical protein RBR02_09595 [Desulfuromonadaceae bacterium]|nr:hypothetical protein [Desulfuromonadaceae bacterium]